MHPKTQLVVSAVLLSSSLDFPCMTKESTLFPPLTPSENLFRLLFFFLSFSFTKSPHCMGIKIGEARQRERGGENDTRTCAFSWVWEARRLLESEKTKERETVCPQNSILEAEDVRVTEAEVAELESRGEWSSVLPRWLVNLPGLDIWKPPPLFPSPSPPLTPPPTPYSQRSDVCKSSASTE